MMAGGSDNGVAVAVARKGISAGALKLQAIEIATSKVIRSAKALGLRGIMFLLMLDNYFDYTAPGKKAKSPIKRLAV